MPSIRHSFVVDRQQEKVWLLLTDFEKFGSQLPHIASVKYVDEKSDISKWTVKGSVGPVTKTFNLLVKSTEKSPPHFLAFRGEGDGLKIVGRVTSERIADNETKITVDLDIDASGGIVGSIVNHLVQSRLPEDIKNSEAKIRELLKVVRR